ncbi:MAG: hypothetical protein ABI132_02835, partial [Rhodanobacteraceae bacterium]
NHEAHKLALPFDSAHAIDSFSFGKSVLPFGQSINPGTRTARSSSHQHLQAALRHGGVPRDIG